MSAVKDAALRGVETALCDAVSKISASYEICLVDAQGDASKEAQCKAIRDRSIGFAQRAYLEMLDAVNRQWPQGF